MRYRLRYLAAPPCRNRLWKAVISEGLAGANNHPTPHLEILYRRWAQSGAGLLLSENVQVDRWHLERPGNIVLDDDSGMEPLKLWPAQEPPPEHFWMQLSHTGRQVDSSISPSPLALSCVEIDLPRGAGRSFDSTAAGVTED